MKLIISHYSAADFWRMVYSATRAPANPSEAPAAGETVSSSEDAWQLAPEWVTPRFLQCEQGVLHTLSLSAEGTRRTKTHVSHRCHAPLPSGSLYRLNEDAYVCSPELVFLQLAQTLDLPQLIAYGCEICGMYGFDPSQERGLRKRTVPLTTKAQLIRYVESARGMRGCKRAHEALRYVVERSASPMETATYLLLTLPYRLGGYGIEKLLVNVEIAVPPRLRPLCPKGFCVADFRIAGTRFVCEYLGKYDHSGNDAMQADRGRTAALREMGFEVLELASKQVWNLDAFEIVAKRFAKESGKRIRSGECGRTPARLGLHHALKAWNAAFGRLPHRPVT